jgi:hypothetical protein
MRKTKINNQTKNQTSKEKTKKTKVIPEVKNNSKEEVINDAKIKKPKQKKYSRKTKKYANQNR